MIRKLKYALLSLRLIIFLIGLLFSQNIYKKDKIKVKCVLPTTTVRDNQDLRAKIITTNISEDTIIVYNELEEGVFNNFSGDNITNLKLIVQRKQANKFREYSKGTFIDPLPTIDTTDNLRKIRIAPKDSAVNYFHIDSRYGFDIGDYRMKCLYWNNVHINESVESSWIYFKVVRPLYVKHYFGEP